MKSKAQSEKFPVLSSEMTRLKETQGGASSMCKVMQRYEDEAVEKNRLRILKNMIKNGISFDMTMKLAEVDQTEWAKYKAMLTT